MKLDRLFPSITEIYFFDIEALFGVEQPPHAWLPTPQPRPLPTQRPQPHPSPPQPPR